MAPVVRLQCRFDTGMSECLFVGKRVRRTLVRRGTAMDLPEMPTWPKGSSYAASSSNGTRTGEMPNPSNGVPSLILVICQSFEDQASMTLASLYIREHTRNGEYRSPITSNRLDARGFPPPASSHSIARDLHYQAAESSS